jgi:hypothetical protein
MFILRIGWGEGGRRADEVNRETHELREPKRHRCDIFVERVQPKPASSVRSGIFRPYGAWGFVAGGSTKMSPLTGLELARRKPRRLSGLGFSLDAGHPAEAGAN